MSIHYSSDTIITAEQVADLFTKSGIRRPIDNLPRLQRMIDGADIIVTAWDNAKLVGVARAISDLSYCCYLSDLAVDREYQNHGIGKELIEQVRQFVGEECTLLLVSAPEANDFYAKIGLEPITTGWMLKRTN